MCKNVIMIHSYNGDTKDSIAPYVEAFCQENEIPYAFPNFPTRQAADYHAWETIMDSYIQQHILNENSIIIAHSLGSQFTIRYLSSKNIRINTYISVAGFVNFGGRKDLETIIARFKPTEKDFENCRGLIANRYSIYADNDKINPIKNLEDYAELLDAQKS